jgi:hypothetical protein
VLASTLISSTIIIGLFSLLINLIPTPISQGTSCEVPTDDSIEEECIPNEPEDNREGIPAEKLEPEDNQEGIPAQNLNPEDRPKDRSVNLLSPDLSIDNIEVISSDGQSFTPYADEPFRVKIHVINQGAATSQAFDLSAWISGDLARDAPIGETSGEPLSGTKQKFVESIRTRPTDASIELPEGPFNTLRLHAGNYKIWGEISPHDLENSESSNNILSKSLTIR